MSGGTGRYTGRVDLSYLKAVESSGSESDKGDDTYRLATSSNRSGRRLSANAVADIRSKLPERDLAVLNSLQELRLATTTQLQRLHFHDHASTGTARRVTRRILTRLINRNLVVRLERRIGGIKAGSAGYIYCLSPTGHRCLGETTRKRLHEPSTHHVRHTLAITEVVTGLNETARALLLDELDIETEPTCWRTTSIDHLPTLKPDLFVRLATSEIELSWFVEIDCNTESGNVLRRKLTAYTDYWRTGTEQRERGVFPRTLWVAPDRDRASFIAQIIETTPGLHPEMFEVTTTDNAVAIMTSFEGQQVA